LARLSRRLAESFRAVTGRQEQAAKETTSDQNISHHARTIL